MKRLFFLLTALALVAALAAPGSVLAQAADTQTWTSSIYYYNPSADSGELSVAYHPNGDSPKYLPTGGATIPVAAHGAGEVFVGDLGVSSSWKGAAVLSSSVPVLAVYEQSPSGSDPNYGRLLYTAFEVSQGGSKVFIPSFVRNVAGYQTKVGVQNISTVEAALTLHFYDTAGNVTNFTVPTAVSTNNSYIFTGDDIPNLPSTFDGSVVIEASAGTIVAAAEEMQTNGRRAYAFEGISSVTNKVYMASMFCRSRVGSQSSSYAIQNAGDAVTKIKVEVYSDVSKKLLGTTTTANVQPGAKIVVEACKIGGTAYQTGTAVITSVAGEELAVVGKVSAPSGIMTAFTGKTSGATLTAVPYVVWSANQAKGYRTTISVMNVGSTTAKNVKAAFYRTDGTLAKQVNMATTAKPLGLNVKAAITPGTAGTGVLRTDGSFRGAVEITSDQPVIVIVRLERKLTGVSGYTSFGEDYVGIPYVAP